MIFKRQATPSFLIVGLGNPGKEYESTRHNVGFEALDYFAKEHNVKVNKYNCKALCGITKIDGKKVILAKPQTYMNNSGIAVAELMSYYKIPTENLIVICDDISLENGKLRIRRSGSNGGHNGLKNIELMIDSQEYKRLKIGVGDRENKNEELKDWVLGHFTEMEKKQIDECVIHASSALSLILEGKIDVAMNLYN